MRVCWLQESSFLVPAVKVILLQAAADIAWWDGRVSWRPELSKVVKLNCNETQLVTFSFSLTDRFEAGLVTGRSFFTGCIPVVMETVDAGNVWVGIGDALGAGLSKGPSCCPSFFVCLSYKCIFSCFYQTPSLLSCPSPVNVCLSVFLRVFSSPFSSSSSVCLSLPRCHSLSTFGETRQEHHPVKFFLCPPPHVCPLSSTMGSNWLLSLSFFVLLIVLILVRTHTHTHTHHRKSSKHLSIKQRFDVDALEKNIFSLVLEVWKVAIMKFMNRSQWKVLTVCLTHSQKPFKPLL